MNDRFIIRNGLIADGSGSKPYTGDILIKDGVIKEAGRLPDASYDGFITLDAAGKYVTPGFIDVHRHADYAVLRDGFGDIELAQGITTIITGACGLTPYPFSPELVQTLTPCLGPPGGRWEGYASYAGAFTNRKMPVNAGAMIGSCSIRASLKGFDASPFTRTEMEKAKYIVSEAVGEGAFGLSLGIMYIPEFYSSADELVQIAGAARGGVLTVHVRGEGDSLCASVAEAVGIAIKSGMPMVVSHFKSCGTKNWGKEIYKAMEIIDKARANTDISVEFYPYTGGSTTLLSLIPPGFDLNRGGAALREALYKSYEGWDNYIDSLGFSAIILNALTTPENAGYNGRNIAEICETENRDPFDFICGVMEREEGRAGVIVMSMSPADVDAVIKLPYSYCISDALYPENIISSHPRLYSAFPKLLRDCVRERGLLMFEEAVRKMTAMPAEKLNIKNRGYIKPGYAADISIFDLNNIKDNSNFKRGGLLASGMDYVFVNGQIAWRGERRAGDFGKFLQRNK